ncbi:SoxW family protein [Yoonia sediminilitoris]|uniref:Thioredoxin-related protein n=1 Tax=Yoonia sediminilitoris TaxID=1286148 RepID=A0A2T6KQT8_9RHOB|nr:thioredoxin family protein [Yoonia sediminilitoris]PUB18917.1 thioredoxin-related protein [Yoonia sediminilitoris]RCW99085.1 thioredoxin-related protein [Yoonia sediminilitoris]
MFRMLLMVVAFVSQPVFAAELGDDGLHKAAWMRDTFLDLREDLAEANAEGKRLMLIIEQRGCIYCKKMHEEVFPMPEIDAALHENFFVVQLNMFGDLEVTDFDGTVLPEKDMVRRWGMLFTPNMVFLPTEVEEGLSLQQAAVATMPGAFGKWTTLNLLNWVVEEGYDSDEPFQKYHARKLQEEGIVE